MTMDVPLSGLQTGLAWSAMLVLVTPKAHLIFAGPWLGTLETLNLAKSGLCR
jgi:hypothetical protein